MAVPNEQSTINALDLLTTVDCGSYWNDPLHRVVGQISGRRSYCSTLPDRVMVEMKGGERELIENDGARFYGNEALRGMPVASPSKAFGLCRAVLMEMGAGDIAALASNVTGQNHAELTGANSHVSAGPAYSLSSIFFALTGGCFPSPTSLRPFLSGECAARSKLPAASRNPKLF